MQQCEEKVFGFDSMSYKYNFYELVVVCGTVIVIMAATSNLATDPGTLRLEAGNTCFQPGTLCSYGK